jgi:predicted hydrolase (HD superfamily)
MPPTSGYAHSERLFWFLENVTAREGTLFPQLKFEVEPMTRKIYSYLEKDYTISLDKVKKESISANSESVKAHASTAPSQAAAPKSKAPIIAREEALAIVNAHIANKNLVKHCIAVEGAMRSLARHFGEDEDMWGIAGLMHDADWEETTEDPAAHTSKTISWLKESGETHETLFRTITAHNFMHNGEPEPNNNFEWSLSCCDELTGLITATTLMIPDKKLRSVQISSIMKKFKNKKFAAALDRDRIALCEAKLGIPLEQFTQIVLEGMIEKEEELGL